eukprot:1158268-Pelagomonas_calceolata.AAC.7
MYPGKQSLIECDIAMLCGAKHSTAIRSVTLSAPRAQVLGTSRFSAAGEGLLAMGEEFKDAAHRMAFIA